MDSYSTRANTIFCTFATVLGTTAFLNHATSYMPNFEATPHAEVSLNKVHDLTVNGYLKMDQSTLSIQMEYDFTSEFNWNMNQLFVYLLVSYNDTSSNKYNEVVIWDNIIQNASAAVMKRQPLLAEYPLRDQHNELRGKECRLHLRYRTMPITGVMYEKEVAAADFKMNDAYFRDESVRKAKQAGKKGGTSSGVGLSVY